MTIVAYGYGLSGFSGTGTVIVDFLDLELEFVDPIEVEIIDFIDVEIVEDAIEVEIVDVIDVEIPD